MKLYELTYLISPEISEQDLKSFSEKINSFVPKEGGVFDGSVKPIKKSLAYPIKKKTATYFQTINFYLAPEKITELKKILEKEKNVLRFVILTKKLFKKEKVRRVIKRVPKIGLAEEKKKPEEKVDLEKIDKKLEEILGNI